MALYNNRSKIAKNIEHCERELDALFNELEVSSNVKKQLTKVENFYRRSFNKTTYESSGQSVLTDYQNLVKALQQVKTGEITADAAYEVIKDAAHSREMNVILHNIAKAFELIFWTTVALTSYAACVLVGVPLIVCEPLIGIAVTFSSMALFILSLENASQCFDEFKSTEVFEQEEEREKRLVSFFKSSSPAASAKNIPVQEVEATTPSASSLS